MPEQIRALIVILTLACSFFYVYRKHLEPLLSTGQFARWRNCWLAVTIIAFTSGNFWLYTGLTALLFAYIVRVEDNRYGLHQLLLNAIPLITARIPGLFDISLARLMALMLVLPAIFKKKLRYGTPGLGRTLADKLFLAFIILATILFMRGLTFTDSLRSGFYLFMDMFLPYYGASRLVKDFTQLRGIIVGFLMGSLIIGVIATFEFSASWLLYNPLANALHVDFDMGGYLARAGDIRAAASTGHSLALGFIMMMSIGLYLFIAPSIQNKLFRYGGFAILGAGSFASLARGSWVGTLIVFLVYFACSPNRFKRAAQLVVAFVIVILILPSIPNGQKVINLLPFIGNTDQFNVDYRSRLLDKSMLIIERAPWFGVFNATKEPEMADMVQGEGIVDIVNTYLGYALGFGLVGLGLLLWLFALALFKLLKTMSRIKDKRSQEYLCGRSLLATMVAILVTIFTVSSISTIDTLYCSMTGLILSYVRIVNQTISEKNRLAREARFAQAS